MEGFIGLPELVDSLYPPLGIDRIGENCRIADSVSIFTDISHKERGKIVLGDNVILFERVRLVTGDTRNNKNAYIQIGSRVLINAGSYISGEGGLTIEDEVLIGPGVKILSAGHDYSLGSSSILSNPLSYGPIKIKKGAWIGAGAIILQGVQIGKGAVVGAGSVVTKDVSPYSVVAGNPARFLRWRPKEEKEERAIYSFLRKLKGIIRVFKKV